MTTTSSPPAHVTSRRRQSWFSRTKFLSWLRKFHIWVGLWGAMLGLLFGLSGILLNHRAIMKIPAAKMQESNVQLVIPNPVPDSAKEMADWLQQRLVLTRPATRVREEPEHPVAWGDKAIIQPARWQMSFATPQMSIQAEYWVGSGMVSVKRNESNFFAVLTNLHKGTGLDAGWVLLADTLAGSIILLSLTGVTLWSQLSRQRAIGLAIVGTSVGLMFVLIAGSL